MKTIFSFLCLTFILSLISASTSPKIIVIGIDGLNPNLINSNHTNLNYLKENGAWTYKARSTTEAWSASGWAQLLCSMDSKLTGIFDNYWLPPWAFGPRNITPITGNKMPFPCVFQHIKTNRPEKKLAYYYNWIWLQVLGNQAMGPYIDDEYYPGNGFFDTNITDRIVNRINSDTLPDFSFIYYFGVDSIGHSKGWGSPQQIDYIDKVDGYIGQILNALHIGCTLKDTYILVTSDHGARIGAFNHGEQNDANLFVPWILYGPTIKKNHEIATHVVSYDSLKTLLSVWGLEGNNLWQGNIIKEAFEINK